MFIACNALESDKPIYGQNGFPTAVPFDIGVKTIALLMLSMLALSSAASGCHAKQSAGLPIQTPKSETTTKALKVLAEGFHSAITHPFVAVIREAETYS